MVKEGIAFVETKFVPLEKAKISATDLAVQRGTGLFETLRTYGKAPLALRERLERIFESAEILGFKLRFSQTGLTKKVLEGIDKLKVREVLVKIIVTAEASHRGFGLVPEKTKLVILFSPFVPPPRKHYEKGIEIFTTKLKRPLPEIKSLSYLSAVVAHRRAKKAGFDEAVYLDLRNNILEGTTFNFAIIKNKTLVTPIHGILEGITMDIVLGLAAKAGLAVKRQEIRYADLKKAQEAFITSASREVMPVVKVDKIKIGNGRPGVYAKLLLQKYREFALNDAKNF
ncbi:MAG: aminotransferase class IV family protein [Candidatus Doudnabacteria bacterium]|nr:aminotransferase class IV family protein [Candidatus Doudnabacteria bacterium]